MDLNEVRVVRGGQIPYYTSEPVAVMGPQGWWRDKLSDLFFNSDRLNYHNLFKCPKGFSREDEEQALRKDAEEWAEMAVEFMDAAGVDAKWLVEDFRRRL